MKHFYWKIIFTLNIIKVATDAAEFPQPQQCVGKHQIPFDDVFEFEIAKELTEPIVWRNLNVTPSQTILENNDFTLVVNMKYKCDAMVPTINFGAESGLGTFRFEFLYFQWFENSETDLPVELHLVFYNTKQTSLENALKQKNMTVILAFYFEIKHSPTPTNQFAILTENIKSVRTGGSKISIENRPLNIWLPRKVKGFFMYEGQLPFYNCQPQVLWADIHEGIILETDLLKELATLQTHSGLALMLQYKPFLRPNGKLVINYGLDSINLSSWESIPLVDVHNLYNDYGDLITLNESIQTAHNMRNVVAVIILYLKLIFVQAYISKI